MPEDKKSKKNGMDKLRKVLDNTSFTSLRSCGIFIYILEIFKYVVMGLTQAGQVVSIPL